MNREFSSIDTDTHPDPDVLRLFAVGQIDEESTISKLEDHLANCPSCLTLLSQVAPDASQRYVANLANELNLNVGEQTPRYELIEEIGRGGLGVVYKARQAGLERLLAWKVLISGNRASVAELARFRREAQALAQLDHPQIVKVHDFGEQDGTMFLAMELVEGPSLAKWLERGPVEPAQASVWLRDLARAIAYAHQRSIFHRDLKPQNVLLASANPAESGPGWIPKIVDFGLAKFETESLFQTQTGETLGTPAYLAPEMVGVERKNQSSSAIDVYGLGAILYHCLTGRPPFIGSSQLEILTAVVADDPPAIQTLRHSVPRDLAVICHRCLRKQPAQRFGTADALAEDLERYLSGIPIVSRPISRIERAVRWCRRNPYKAIAVSLSCLGLLAVPAAAIYHNSQLHREKMIAQTRYESTRDTLWKMLNVFDPDRHGAIPQAVELSAKQTEEALTLFAELAEADPSAQSQLDLAKAKILAGSLAVVLGKWDDAETHLTQAIDLCERLQGDSKDSRDALESLAAGLNKLALVRPQTEDSHKAIDFLERALTIHRQLAEDSPEDPTARGRIAWSLMNLGAAQQIQGNLADAVSIYQETIPIWDGLARESFNAGESQQAAAGCRINLATIQLKLNQSQDAEVNFRVALEILEKLWSTSPHNHSIVEDLTSGLLNYSNCLQTNGRTDEAIEACARSRTLLLEAIEREPNRNLLRQNLFLVTANRANLLGSSNRAAEAELAWKQAIEIAPDDPIKTYCQQMRLGCLADIGDVETAQKELASMDETKMAANEKFLQAVCWAKLAKACLNPVNPNAQPNVLDHGNHAASRAWTLLEGLSASDELKDTERREHLRTSDDWSAVRHARSRQAFDQLIRDDH